MIYEIAKAHQMVAAGYVLEERDGGLFWLVRGNKEFRVHRNVVTLLRS